MIVVGGTGMLRDVSVYLTQKGCNVTVIARNQKRLNTLVEESGSVEGCIHPVQVDYRDDHLFIHQVEKAISTYGPIRMAVVWIHSTAPQAPYQLASLLNETTPSCDYFHVLGSSVADPSQQDGRRKKQFMQYPHIQYHEVILGFVVEKNGSRWLTNKEISQGVIRAIQSNQKQTVVGTVDPWSKKP
ncbi:short-chain dehydrogenase [Melghirimyces algeriensis]|uniref:short-chain dehydrogenase n=1 Tax=Melghirimyces algeriensis TaxID=910412 RepID=UPI00248309B0|nr:short-chain dehydrogenase [Melghirimyces algeriensis]